MFSSLLRSLSADTWKAWVTAMKSNLEMMDITFHAMKFLLIPAPARDLFPLLVSNLHAKDMNSVSRLPMHDICESGLKYCTNNKPYSQCNSSTTRDYSNVDRMPGERIVPVCMSQMRKVSSNRNSPHRPSRYDCPRLILVLCRQARGVSVH